MIHKIKQRLALITAFLCLTGMIYPAGLYAVKAETLNFDETDVMEDLESSTVDGAKFNIHNYPYDEDGQAKIINFVEYCYSYKTNMQINYGLYIYVYNPQGLNFNTKTTSNKIQIATGYNTDGTPNDYEKYSLQFLSMSTEPNYYRLFYKFKIIDTNKTILERVNENSSQRRYDVSGFELFPEGATNAIEYTVGGTYTFTGYSDGYGATEGTELECDVREMDIIELELKHTFFRTGLSDKGQGYQNQLDSVYFAVDNKYFEKYEKIQKIKAEWYEYKTQPIVVTSNSAFYNSAINYIGHQIESNGNENIGYSLVSDFQLGMSPVPTTGNIGFNSKALNNSVQINNELNSLIYLFSTDSINSYDPYGNKTIANGVESNDLSEWIKNYNTTYNTGTLPIKSGTISKDLFLNGVVDEGRLYDYNIYDFDSDIDILQMESWKNGNPSFWDKLTNFGFGDLPILDSGYYNIPPIITLKNDNFIGSNVDVSKNLLVRTEDLNDLKSFFNTAEDMNKTVVLLRFATTDYFSEKADIFQLNGGTLGADKQITDEAYVAQETVFLDFDVIQLTFNKAGNYIVIPVVASPIDIVNPITDPLANQGSGCNSINSDNLKWIIIIIIFVALLILFAPLFPYVIKGIIYLILLPFKILKWIILKAAGKPKKRKKKRKK